MIKRGEKHDASKLESPEREGYEEVRTLLSNIEYGSPEYMESLKKLKPTLDHHYAKNSHHPEHWKNGINDMTLLDIVEHFFDCLAATRRMKNGNIQKSIETNAQRFNINPQLVRIFENTAKLYE